MHYKINATNCGQCPSTADTNSVTCDIPNNVAFEQICVLTVEAVVCGNVTSEYSGETKKLIKIFVQLITSGLVRVTIIIMYLQQFYTIMTVRIPTMLSHTPSTTLILPPVTRVARSHCQLHLVMMDFVLVCMKCLHLHAHHKPISVCLLLLQTFLAMGSFLIV